LASQKSNILDVDAEAVLDNTVVVEGAGDVGEVASAC
jgi:hypothetical protein